MLAVAMVPMGAVLKLYTEAPTVIYVNAGGKKVATSSTSTKTSSEKTPSKRADATEESKEGPAAPRMGSGSMFDNIAVVYDKVNKWMTFGLDEQWRATMVKECMQLRPDDKVLDLATGTADVGIHAAQQLRHLGNPGPNAVWGLDPSQQMLKVGVQKVHDKNLQHVVRLVKGDAQDLREVQVIDMNGDVAEKSPGLAEGTVDKISMSFGIRNVPDRTKAVKEMVRMLRRSEQSRVCILELSQPTGDNFFSRLAQLFITEVVPLMGKVATMGSATGGEEYAYFIRSILRFPKPLEFAEELADAGLSVETITSFAFGAVNLYTAKPTI